MSEIDIKENNTIGINGEDIIDCFKRRKKIIFTITFIATLISLTTAIFKKHVWEGEFIIKLNKNDISNVGILPSLSSLTNMQGGTTAKSELVILKSPYVLNPIFEDVKNYQKLIGNDISKFKFKKWSKNLTIEAKTNTILSTKYKDFSKEHIKDVLNKISKEYQEYSIKEKENFLKDTNDLLKRALLKAREENLLSSRKLNKFMMENSIEGRLKITDQILGDSNILKQSIANLKKSIEIEKQKNNSEMSKKLERRLKISEGIYKRINENKEIILKFQQLQRDAIRKEAARNKLERDYFSFQVENSKRQKPWTVISEPTLGDYPILPRKKRLVILGSINGLFLGLLLAFITDILSKKIYSLTKFKKLIKARITKTINYKNSSKETEEISQIIVNNNLYKENIFYKIIPLDLENNITTNKLYENLSKILNDKNKVKIAKNFKEVINKDVVIVIVTLGNTIEEQILELNSYLALGEVNIDYLLINKNYQ